MEEENPPVIEDEQMEGGAEFSNKKFRRRKKQLYENIRKQMEFYFSDANLTKDRFLGKLIMEDPNIDISTFLRFNRIRALTTDPRDIVSALKGSELLSVTEDGTKVFRTTPVTEKANTDDCTIYVEQLPPDAQHDWLKEVFSAYGNVSYVSIPKYKLNGKIKGFAFVEFETPEEANKTLEAFGAMGCRLSPQMAPETLCSIKTFEPDEGTSEVFADEGVKTESVDEDPENSSKKKKNKKQVKLQVSGDANMDPDEHESEVDSTDLTKSKKRKKSEEDENVERNIEKESIEDDSPPKKKKQKKNDSTETEGKREEDNLDVQQTEVVEAQPEKKKLKRKNEETEDKSIDEESENSEVQVSKKKCKKSKEKSEEVEDNKEVSEETEKNSERKKRKRKSEDEIKEDIAEDVENPDEVTNEGEMEETGEEMQEEGDENKRRRRKRKKHKKKKQDAEAERLKILSKKEWKRLRNKYLDLQKAKMKCLKHYLGKNKWGKSTPARSQPSNGNVQEKEEVAKVQEVDKKPRLNFTPGVIVHAVLEEPVMDIKKFKADAKSLSEVEYVDIVMGGNDAFIRCANPSAAENLLSSAPWQHTEILKGDDEKSYWDRIFVDRHEKLSQKVRVKQRGRNKVLRRAERELGKHIRFDD